MNRFRGLVFDIGACVQTDFDEDDFLVAQPDGISQEPRLGGYELHAPFGLFSRPLDPETGPNGQVVEGGACNLLTATQGDETHAWFLGDPRIVKLLPLPKKGQSGLYGSSGAFMRVTPDGKITSWTTTTNAPEGQGVFFQVAPDGLVFSAPWGTWRFDATGWHVRTASGARHDMGGIAGMPAPLDALSSYNTLRAHMCSVEGSAVSQGTDGGATNEAAVAALLVWVTAVTAALAGLGVVVPPPAPTVTNIGKVV